MFQQIRSWKIEQRICSVNQRIEKKQDMTSEQLPSFTGRWEGAQKDLARSKLDYKCCRASLRRNSARGAERDTGPREVENIPKGSRIVPQSPGIAWRLQTSQRSPNESTERVVLLKHIHEFFDTSPFKSWSQVPLPLDMVTHF